MIIAAAHMPFGHMILREQSMQSKRVFAHDWCRPIVDDDAYHPVSNFKFWLHSGRFNETGEIQLTIVYPWLNRSVFQWIRLVDLIFVFVSLEFVCGQQRDTMLVSKVQIWTHRYNKISPWFFNLFSSTTRLYNFFKNKYDRLNVAYTSCSL